MEAATGAATPASAGSVAGAIVDASVANASEVRPRPPAHQIAAATKRKASAIASPTMTKPPVRSSFHRPSRVNRESVRAITGMICVSTSGGPASLTRRLYHCHVVAKRGDRGGADGWYVSAAGRSDGLVCPGEAKGAHRPQGWWAPDRRLVAPALGYDRNSFLARPALRWAGDSRPGSARDQLRSVVTCGRDMRSVTMASMTTPPTVTVERIASPDGAAPVTRPARDRVTGWSPLGVVAAAIVLIGVSGVRGADYPAHFVRALLWERSGVSAWNNLSACTVKYTPSKSSNVAMPIVSLGRFIACFPIHRSPLAK